MSTYSEAYLQLNPEQKKAVDTIEGPVMVLAGPGTGKTQILSTRIANILQKTDVQPHNILALTFTNAGAKNLQQRLVSLIGPVGYSVSTGTFHHFCAQIIDEHPEYFAVASSGSDPVSEVDKYTILETIFSKNEFPHIKNAKYPLLFLKDTLSLISDYKREGHTPSSLGKLAAKELLALEDDGEITEAKKRPLRQKINKNLDVIVAYREYQKELRARHLFDFDDMILWVRDAFRANEDLRLEYQERFQYFLIDEFQDTNESQLQVVRELASYWGENANIFVVGDPNQSIYRFQGASLANTLSFLDFYPNAEVISLKTGYRCGDVVYKAAADVIKHNELSLADPRIESLHDALQSQDHHVGKIITFEAANPLAEALWVTKKIKELQAEKVPLHEIAVLYHKHANAFLLEEVLQHEQIQAQKTVGGDLLDNHLIQQILALLRYLHYLRKKLEGPELLTALQLPWLELPAGDVLQLLREGSNSKPHKYSVWDLWCDKETAEKFEWQDWPKLHKLCALFKDLQEKETQLPLPLYVEEVLRETGFYRFFTKQKPLSVEDLAAAANLMRLLQVWYRRDTYRTVGDFLNEIEKMRQHHLTIKQEPVELISDAVELSTAHNAKGREWQYVFILHAHDTVWGNTRRPHGIAPLANTIPYADLDKAEHNEDERRLFYVAMTRAKKQLIVSFSQQEADNDRIKVLQPTQFLAEIEDPVTKAEAMEPDELQEALRRWTLDRQEPNRILELDKVWLRKRIEDFSLSFSALQDLLTCPIAFLYKRLLRLPQLPEAPLALGTAVHAALEHLYRELNKNGEVPPLASLTKLAHDILNGYAFPEDQLVALQNEMKKTLTGYYNENKHLFQPSLMVERRFGTMPPVVFEGIKLNGKVDCIDLVDADAKQVCIVDYKTGRLHSHNDILGKTASSDGMMFKQLLFYKLLADSDPSFGYSVNEGEFIFLNPTDAGKYKTERFTLSETDMDEFKELLRGVKQDMLELKFLDREPCGHCEICNLLGFTRSEVEGQKILLQE